MTGSWRDLAKRMAPRALKQALWRARTAIGGPPIDDAVLARYALLPDPHAGLRLNLVIPDLARGSAFGGVMTGIDLLLQLALRLGAPGRCALRVVLTDPDRASDRTILLDEARRAGIAPQAIAFAEPKRDGGAIAVGPGDIFVTYNWWTTLNTLPLLDAQAAHFGHASRPLLYLIQEYEPQMLPFSSAHLLAREAYDAPQRLWGLFNSASLHAWFTVQRHRTERAFVFEPVINPRLRPALERVGQSQRERRIVIYGRPAIARNCYPALIRGLRRWASDHPEQAGWEVVSVGTPHRPVRLDRHRVIRSLGKLALEDYAELLLSSSVGVSLMASPHPGYTALEMAHFGLRTITNGYPCKDLADYHPGLAVLGSIGEETLGAAIARACDDAATPSAPYGNPAFLRAEAYPFLDELCAALREEPGLDQASGR